MTEKERHPYPHTLAFNLRGSDIAAVRPLADAIARELASRPVQSTISVDTDGTLGVSTESFEALQSVKAIVMESAGIRGTIATSRPAVEPSPVAQFVSFAPPPERSRAQKRTDDRLERLCAIIPRRYREALRGDLREDVAEYRRAGWAETRIRRHVRWQVAVIILERCKGVFRWGAIAWLGRKIGGWIAGQIG